VGDKSDPAIWQECVEMWSRVLNEGQFVCLRIWLAVVLERRMGRLGRVQTEGSK